MRMGKKLIKKKRKRKKVPLYRKCDRCGSHAYLTMGKFYQCTNQECKYRDYQNITDEAIQEMLKDEARKMKND